MTATAVASCPCIPDEVLCAWSGYKNKLNCYVLNKLRKFIALFAGLQRALIVLMAS